MKIFQLVAVLYMVLSMVAYQISASFAKQLIATLDPLTVTILTPVFCDYSSCHHVPLMESDPSKLEIKMARFTTI